jgi:hypothetical protein
MTFLAALLYALLMNAIPLAEVWWSGRSPAALVLLFWFETVLGLVTGAIRIVLHRRATAMTGHHAPTTATSDKDTNADDVVRQLGDENTYLRHFLGLTTVFTIVHGVFVLLLVFLFRIAGPLSWEDAKLALAWAVAVQAVFLFADLPRIGSWSFLQLGQSVGQVSIRVLVTQVGLIFGLVGMLVGLRALADAAIAWLTGLMKMRDLPPGFKRFLARRAKQSEDQVEAEFDALKEKGADVEKLLERPIGEVRAGKLPAQF